MPPRASIRVQVLVMQKRADYSSCQEETLLINNEYMTIGQVKAKTYWFALCLTDVFYNSSIILLIVSNIPGSLFPQMLNLS